MAGEQTTETNDTTPDDSTEGDQTPDAGKVTFTAEQQAHIDSLIGQARKQGREKATADHQQAAEKAKTEAEQARLKEKEEFKTLAEQHAARVAELEAELSGERMRRVFYEQVDAQELVFANPQARQDAYTLATLPDDVDGMADAVKALTGSHPHLFGKAAPGGKNVNSLDTGNSDVGEVTEAEVQEFATRYGVDPRYVNKEDVAKSLGR